MEKSASTRLSGTRKTRKKAAVSAVRPRGERTRPVLNENSLRVLEKRYLMKDGSGRVVETPEELFRRVSRNIASAEVRYDPKADVEAVAREFYEMMASLEFLPNSPTLMNAGRELQQLSACFVLPVEDSMESIFEAIKHTALIHKSGGGTGFSFSSLRPSGDVVGSTSGISSGPISFMTVFDSATEAIKQGGTRRGANMGILRVDHPDIMDFITCKVDNAKLNNFNISVSLTEAFMEAVEKDTDYSLVNPRTGGKAGSLRARDVFDKIVHMAWTNGDPGIIFIDRINADNPTPHVGSIDATNPCGEQPLLPYESCNLGSINLSRMVRPSSNGLASMEIDWDLLEETVFKAVHFLDNVIDVNRYPIEQIERCTKGNRKIGLGVMGFADMLIRLGIPYDSDEAVAAAERIMAFIAEKGREASSLLAEKRGCFPNYKGSVHHRAGRPMRNATVTTIAPTGTISIIAGTSSGIEPLFALAFTRNVLDGAELLEVNPLFEEAARSRGFDSPELLRELAEKGSVHGIEGVPDDIKRVFVTAHDISPHWHIRMQAAFQKHTDNAVSKTVNFPNDATPDDVAEVYLMAYRTGCKGVTVYRDGSREVQVLNKGSEKGGEKKADEQAAARAASPVQARPHPKPRGEVAFGITRKIKTGCGNLYVTINEDEEGRPCEVFTQIGKAGGCVASQCEAIGRMASLALRSGIDAAEIVKQMRGISCHLPVGYGDGRVMSCADAMAQALIWYLNFKSASNEPLLHGGPAVLGADAFKKTAAGSRGSGGLDLASLTQLPKRGACPDCGGAVEHSDGCVVCRGCGYTECG
ncbi:MAG TPA: vitamin B12-dependent ribonucleotide reductase [Deltaproteobacteria bacterium]|nr:vitamin B12-dependent ribonucleotide reductase [Deltaproteobacteria bacterium]